MLLGNYGQCTFDENLCNWSQMTDDDFDWQRSTTSMLSLSATGPSSDHSGSKNDVSLIIIIINCIYIAHNMN